MGWASAGDIFDPVAQALIDCDADEATKRRVLGDLIDKLRDGDWDTEDESLYEFRHDLVVVSLFYARDVGGLRGGDGVEGVIVFDGQTRAWVLSCDRCGELGRMSFTAAGHDGLVRYWAGHDRSHGGDGEVQDWMLLGGDPEPEGQPLSKGELTAEALAELFHTTYERLAPDFGYRTREASAKPWSEVPEGNRRLMVATCGEVLAALGPVAERAAS